MATTSLELYYEKSQKQVKSTTGIERKFGDIDIKTIIKELGQNALDAKFSSDKPVELEIKIIKVPSKLKPLLLNKIGLTDLDLMIKRLNLMAKYERNEKERFHRMLEILQDDKKDIHFLVVSDYNTFGLTGSDILDLDSEGLSRFAGFNLMLGFSEKSEGLGSFGEGRLAAIASSIIQYVYEVSHLAEKWRNRKYRKFGLGFQGIFQEKTSSSKQIYSGVFFSCRKLSKDIFRSLMLDNLSDESFLVPTKRGDKTGTTFIFPFADIKNLVKQSEEEIDVIEDFERRFLSIARNEAEKIFFPSIANSSLVITFLYEEFTNKKLETKFDGVLNKNNLEKVLSLLADDASYEKGFDISKHAKYTTNTIKRRVTLRIPDRQYHGKKTEEFIPLKLIEVDMDKMADDLKSFLQPLINRVLCARDGMIIEPKKIDIYPRVDFIGLLDVRKDNPENEKSQDFLRSSESIKHNKWKATETRLRNIYGNTSGPKSLRDFFKEINRIVNEEFGIEETDTKQLPKEILSEIFKDLGIRDIGTRIKEKEDKKLVPEYLKKQRIREKKQTPSPSETKPKPKRKTVSEKDVFNLHPKFLFRNLNEIGVEIYLPENRSYVLNLTLTPTVTSYDKQVEIQLPFDIYDNKENRIKDYSKISEINFPLKALISLETIPLRLRDIAIIGLSIMGEN